MRGHYDLDVCQAGELTRIHFGYFCELEGVSGLTWADAIYEVEPILIKSHMPALNGKDVKGFLENPDTTLWYLTGAPEEYYFRKFQACVVPGIIMIVKNIILKK